MKKCSITILLLFIFTLIISINVFAANNQQINILSGTPDAETITFDIGDGSDGDLTVSSNATVAGGKNYNNLRITSSGYLTITGSGILRVKGTLQIEGTLKFADGGSGIDAVTGIVNANSITCTGGKIISGNGGTSGSKAGDIKLYCNNITINETSTLTLSNGGEPISGGTGTPNGNFFLYCNTGEIHISIQGINGTVSSSSSKNGSSIYIYGVDVSVKDLRAGNAQVGILAPSGSYAVAAPGNFTVKANNLTVNNGKLTAGNGILAGVYGTAGGNGTIKVNAIQVLGTSGYIAGGTAAGGATGLSPGIVNMTAYKDCIFENTFFNVYITANDKVRFQTNSSYNTPWSAGTISVNNISVTTPSCSANVNSSGLNTISLSDFYAKYGAQNFDFIIERYVDGLDGEYKQVAAFIKPLSNSLEWIDWDTIAKKDVSYRIIFRKSLGVAPVSKDFANKSGFIFIDPYVFTSRSEGGSGLKVYANNGSNPFKVIKGVPFIRLIYGPACSGSSFENSEKSILVKTIDDEYSIIEGTINTPLIGEKTGLAYYILDTGITRLLFEVINPPNLNDIATVTFQ